MKPETNKTKRKIQKDKNILQNLSTIFKTYTKVFSFEYTLMEEVLPAENIKQMYTILKNKRASKEEFRFALCTPVYM